jgi:hypothetical protein
VRKLETFCTQPETRVDFFYFFARNPLKSPIRTNKSKEIQAILLGFIWICLDGIRRRVVFAPSALARVGAWGSTSDGGS